MGGGDGGPRYHARRLPDPTVVERARRAGALATIFARRLGPTIVRQSRRRTRAPFDPATWAAPLRRAFEDAGGTFVKFGQIVASSSGLFGEALSQEFRACLDTGPPVDLADVRATIEDELGDDLESLFGSFDPRPIGRASIAVVYRATLPDGTPVAVKVLRPGIARHVATDLDLMEPLFTLLTRHTGDQLAGATLQQLDGLRLQIGEELDLRNEARALAHFGRIVAELGLDRLVVPRPHLSHSSGSVLTMDLLDGAPIDDLAEVAALGVDPAPLLDELIRGFLAMTVRWRTFHGDIHAGNLLLLRDGRLGVIDWGIVGRLDDATYRFFTRVLAGVAGDDAAWDDVAATIVEVYGPAVGAAVGLDPADLGPFLRSMVEPILREPFGKGSVASLMTVTQARVAAAHGVDFRTRRLREVWARLRLQRRIHKMALAGGGLMSDFDRGNFLLAKQLMYFERYGRMYLAGRAIVDDPAFLRELLVEGDGTVNEGG